MQPDFERASRHASPKMNRTSATSSRRFEEVARGNGLTRAAAVEGAAPDRLLRDDGDARGDFRRLGGLPQGVLRACAGSGGMFRGTGCGTGGRFEMDGCGRLAAGHGHKDRCGGVLLPNGLGGDGRSGPGLLRSGRVKRRWRFFECGNRIGQRRRFGLPRLPCQSGRGRRECCWGNGLAHSRLRGGIDRLARRWWSVQLVALLTVLASLSCMMLADSIVVSRLFQAGVFRRGYGLRFCGDLLRTTGCGLEFLRQPLP